MSAFIQLANGGHLTKAFVGHHYVGVSPAHLLLLLAPVLDPDWLVGLYHVCDLQLWVHLEGETKREERVREALREI